ncbi:unnamed protein product [Nezara viridula]|uniref:TOG domain-containing protein n=1 Tax=Nezara viridula TaxID=85310 RepID=A0A9P0EJ26_NEZVI|nr:unnamed protein product [Nezara viridula]
MEECHKFCPKCSEKRGVIGPDVLLLELGDKCYEKFSAADWCKRKESLEKLQKILQTSQLLKDGDYRPLLYQLRKIILTDLCVIVVGLAVQCVTSLAKGLSKHFAKYAEGMFQILFEKFVEKRQRMTELLREAVDTIFETTKFESLQNTIIKLLKHQNPSIRYELILFLARSFPKCNKRVLAKPQFQPLFLSLKALLADGDIVIREKTLAALGVAVQIAGEKAIMPYIRDLDLASKAKIEVYQMRAWEIAKTYNEMKFPNFREKLRKPNMMAGPNSQSTFSQISISTKEQASKSELIYSTSNRSMNTVSLNGWPSESEKQGPEVTSDRTGRPLSIQPSNNMPTITEVSNMQLKCSCSKETNKELSLPAGCRLNESECTHSSHNPKPEHRHISSHSNINVKPEQSSNVDKLPKKDTLNESQNEVMIQQYTDQCLAEVTHHLKELTNEHRLITYKPTTKSINEIHTNETEINKSLSTVHVESEKEIEESQVGFTQHELDDLLYILNAARFRARTNKNLKFKRILNSRKNRFTTMSKGFLSKADHKETQCTSAVSLVDKPTQTQVAKEENPKSVSCIVNCCEKCTRLLLATAPRNSKYLFPVNMSHNSPLQHLDESSDNTVYRQLISSDRIQEKSESDLIKNTIENNLAYNYSHMNHNPELSGPNEIKNFMALHKQESHDKLQNNLQRKEVEKSSVCSNAQQTGHENKSSSKLQDKRLYLSSKKGKVSTCNKTTFVTTTSTRKRKRRKRNRSTFAGLDELYQENRKEWLKKEFCKAESKRAMKVRVIRIE